MSQLCVCLALSVPWRLANPLRKASHISKVVGRAVKSPLIVVPAHRCLTDGPFLFQAKLLESSHAWLGASTSSIAADYTTLLKLKAPTWTRHDLQEAIEAVVTQKMRFTQASTKYGIPKGTLYDNILGKSKRMMILEETALDPSEETAVLEFCCDISVSPYNRRTKKSLNAILNFVERLRRKHDPGFMFTGLSGFRWWWAFCKKHSIVSLYINDENENGADSS
ncbi:hypothetical protein ALC53_05951 [Atta colombica]|uniref:HTH psq-type domain-containing protein n=1 Tax=Atta colombica TaxID=520822 RepID=A0A195BHA6_9HYME|nr:hypothetical protein ALC53_05951 [Atta colombica]